MPENISNLKTSNESKNNPQGFVASYKQVMEWIYLSKKFTMQYSNKVHMGINTNIPPHENIS
jgi:hypothetical protein